MNIMLAKLCKCHNKSAGRWTLLSRFLSSNLHFNGGSPNHVNYTCYSHCLIYLLVSHSKAWGVRIPIYWKLWAECVSVHLCCVCLERMQDKRSAKSKMQVWFQNNNPSLNYISDNQYSYVTVRGFGRCGKSSTNRSRNVTYFAVYK